MSKIIQQNVKYSQGRRLLCRFVPFELMTPEWQRCTAVKTECFTGSFSQSAVPEQDWTLTQLISLSVSETLGCRFSRALPLQQRQWPRLSLCSQLRVRPRVWGKWIIPSPPSREEESWIYRWDQTEEGGRGYVTREEVLRKLKLALSLKLSLS